MDKLHRRAASTGSTERFGRCARLCQDSLRRVVILLRGDLRVDLSWALRLGQRRRCVDFVWGSSLPSFAGDSRPAQLHALAYVRRTLRSAKPNNLFAHSADAIAKREAHISKHNKQLSAFPRKYALRANPLRLAAFASAQHTFLSLSLPSLLSTRRGQPAGARSSPWRSHYAPQRSHIVRPSEKHITPPTLTCGSYTTAFEAALRSVLSTKLWHAVHRLK